MNAPVKDPQLTQLQAEAYELIERREVLQIGIGHLQTALDAKNAQITARRQELNPQPALPSQPAATPAAPAVSTPPVAVPSAKAVVAPVDESEEVDEPADENETGETEEDAA